MRMVNLHAVAALTVAVFVFSVAESSKEIQLNSTDCGGSSSNSTFTSTSTSTTSPPSSPAPNSCGSSCGSSKNESLLPGTFIFHAQRVDYTTRASSPVKISLNLNESGILDPVLNVTCYNTQSPFEKLGQQTFGNGYVCLDYLLRGGSCNGVCPVQDVYYYYEGDLADPTTGKVISVQVSFELDEKGTLNPQKKITCVDGHYGSGYCDCGCYSCGCDCGCPTSGRFTYEAIRVDTETGAQTPVRISYTLGPGSVSNLSQITEVCPKC